MYLPACYVSQYYFDDKLCKINKNQKRILTSFFLMHVIMSLNLPLFGTYFSHIVYHSTTHTMLRCYKCNVHMQYYCMVRLVIDSQILLQPLLGTYIYILQQHTESTRCYPSIWPKWLDDDWKTRNPRCETNKSLRVQNQRM